MSNPPSKRRVRSSSTPRRPARTALPFLALSSQETTRVTLQQVRPQALGRRDRQGRRQLPGLRRADARRRSSTGSAASRRAAARANGELGLLDPEHRQARSPPPPTRSPPASTTTSSRSTSSRPARAPRSNMNANEVIANLAGEGVHPNDHVNMGQSCNDVFPSRRAPRRARPRSTHDLLPALKHARAVARPRRRASSRTSSSPAART